MMLAPIAAWIATSNIWRGISSRIFATTSRPRYCALARCTMIDSASTLLAVDQDVDLDHVGGAVLLELVVHATRSRATRDFSLSKKSSTISASGIS